MKPVKILAVVLIVSAMMSPAQSVQAMDFFDMIKEKAAGLYTSAKDAYKDNIRTTIAVCAAKELQPWIKDDVSREFARNNKKTKVQYYFKGSGELVKNMRDGNKEECDIFIPGSDVAGLQWKGFKKGEATSVAYSPTVWVGLKSKVDAARTELGIEANTPLTCTHILQLATTYRKFSQFAPELKGRVKYEITTFNSGQSKVVSTDTVDKAASEAYIATMLQERVQRALLKYNFRPASAEVDTNNNTIFTWNIEIADAPSDREELQGIWEIVEEIKNVDTILGE